MQKIYLVGKKVDGEITMVPIRAFHTFESAKKHLLKHVPSDRQIVETELKNEFRVLDQFGNYIHTITIRDMWLAEE